MAYVCPHHGVELEGACPDCVRDFRARKSPAEMTRPERAAALDRLFGVLTIPFPDLHQWVEELVGRTVWTHEMASKEALRSEILHDEARA